MAQPVDVASNRAMRKWTRKEQIGRVIWALSWPFFRYSPRPLWGWRRWMLKQFGAQIGSHVHVHPNVNITIPWNLNLEEGVAIGDRAILYALGPITIGSRTTISQGAHLCAGTHNWRDPRMPLVKAPITIKSDVWVCADAFVGPDVTLGAYCILGARAVAMKSVGSGVIAIGNPARVVSHRQALTES